MCFSEHVGGAFCHAGEIYVVAIIPGAGAGEKCLHASVKNNSAGLPIAHSTTFYSSARGE